MNQKTITCISWWFFCLVSKQLYILVSNYLWHICNVQNIFLLTILHLMIVNVSQENKIASNFQLLTINYELQLSSLYSVLINNYFLLTTAYCLLPTVYSSFLTIQVCSQYLAHIIQIRTHFFKGIGNTDMKIS